MEDRLAKAWATLGSNAGPPVDLEKLAIGGLVSGGLRLAGRGRGALRAVPGVARQVARPVLQRGAQIAGAGVALAPVAMRGLSHVAPAARQVATHAPGAAAHGSRGLALVDPKGQPAPPSMGAMPSPASRASADLKKSLFDSAAPDQIGTQGSGRPRRRAANDKRRRLVVPGGSTPPARGGFGSSPGPARGGAAEETQRQLDASLRGTVIPASARNRGFV